MWAWLLSHAPPNGPPTFIDSNTNNNLQDIMSALLVNMPNVTDGCIIKKIACVLSLSCVFLKARVVAECWTFGLGLAVGGKLLGGVAATCDTRLVNRVL